VSSTAGAQAPNGVPAAKKTPDRSPRRSKATPGEVASRHHPKWKTKTITEKKAIKYATTQPNLRHSRFDLGHHAQNAYPASRAFGTMINICSHVGHAG
jgi:hypothetical protein